MASMKLQPRACPICHSLDDSQSFAEANVDLEELDGFAFASRNSYHTTWRACSYPYERATSPGPCTSTTWH